MRGLHASGKGDILAHKSWKRRDPGNEVDIVGVLAQFDVCIVFLPR